MADMENLDKIIANNITELRKAHKWTQAELAEKLNYSDKSVSKWERGDSVPDVAVLSEMAGLFGVTLDYFVHENAMAEKEKYKVNVSERGYKVAASMLAVMVVWFIATVSFVYVQIMEQKNHWMIFVWAVPVSLIIMRIYDRRWFGRKLELIISSLFFWTLISAFYLSCLIYMGANVWMIYFIGAPLQASLILMHIAKKGK